MTSTAAYQVHLDIPLLKEAMENTESWPQTSTIHWPDMRRNELVSVSRDGHVLYEGLVDDRTDDGTVVWILPKNGYRLLLHIADGFQLSKVRA